jgi:malic enzyme
LVLGDIGADAALPVMEGKALLMKRFAGLDAWPICLDTKDPDEIVTYLQGNCTRHWCHQSWKISVHRAVSRLKED